MGGATDEGGAEHRRAARFESGFVGCGCAPGDDV